MNVRQATQAYDIALAACERAPTEANIAAHDAALEVLCAARRAMDEKARADRMLARCIVKAQGIAHSVPDDTYVLAYRNGDFVPITAAEWRAQPGQTRTRRVRAPKP